MKQSLMNLSPRFNCQRMVSEYMSQLYEPAHRAYQTTRQDAFAGVRRQAQWNAGVQSVWERVQFVEIGPEPEGALLSGQPMPLRAVVDLAGLKPDDVRVEAVIGSVGIGGRLERTEVLTLPPAGQQGAAVVFAREFVPSHTGRLGYCLRISPNHSDDPLTRPCNALLKWS